MKKFSFGVLFSLVAIIAIVSGAFAATSDLPGSGWWTGEQIQNIGTVDSTVTVTAYDAGSANTYEASHSVAPGGAFTFTPTDFSGMPAGFEGSAVVTSSEPIKAIVNITNRPVGTLGIAGGKAAAQYQGTDGSAVADTLYFPLVKGDSFQKTTTFYIQNAGSAVASWTADFTMRDGTPYQITGSGLGVNQMAAFSVLDASGFNPSSNDGRVGSLVVSADQPLAGTVVEHFTAENPATIAQSTRGFTAADFSTTAYAPVIKNTRFSRFTGIQVQNVSGGPVDITVNYAGTAGACKDNTYTDSATGVADGSAKTFVQLPGQTNLPTDCTASATVEATGNIVAVVNESYVGSMVPASGQAAVTSYAIPSTAATTTVSAPLFKDDRFEKRTGLQIQNVGSATATNIVATFACTGAASFTAVSNPQTVAAGAAVLFYTPSDDFGMFSAPFSSSDVNCSVTITSDQNIVAIANESVVPGGSLEQDNNNYEGFNLP